MTSSNRRQTLAALSALSVGAGVLASNAAPGGPGETPPTAPTMHANVPTYPELRGRIALVTGGSGAIGASTCRHLAMNGMKVAVNGRNPQAVAAVVEAIRASNGEALGVPADCTKPDELARIRADIERHWGPVDALLAFAGGSQSRPTPLQDVTEQNWRDALDDNLTTTFNTLKAFLPSMAQRKRGAIVTMSSAGGILPGAPIAYGAAKAGVIMLTREVAADVGRLGVRANCLAPSTVRNDKLMGNTTESQREQMANLFPLGRIGEPADVAGAALFLISDSSSWITGITLNVAGGRVMM